jgi:hypothetical protein
MILNTKRSTLLQAGRTAGNRRQNGPAAAGVGGARRAEAKGGPKAEIEMRGVVQDYPKK